MADVEIKYNNATIASLNDSGTDVLETNGTYLTDDITVEYTKSGGGGESGMLVTISHVQYGNIHTYTMDKTAEEIKAALDSGISPVFYDVYNSRYESIYVILIGGGYYLSVQKSRTTNEKYTASTASSYPSYTYTSGGDND